MPIDDRTADDRYHHHRAEQERGLAKRARTREARESHAELMRLHESRRDALPPSG